MGHGESSPARTLIIAIVVLTSALSFALGYFVGKEGQKEKPQPQLIALQKQDILPPVQEQIVQPDVNETKNNTAQQSPPENLKQTKETVKKEEAPAQNSTLYTVQTGAFKNPKDAEALKRKLDKKGYKAYIKKAAAGNNMRLYKVRTGKYQDRKDADSAVLKLKKAGFKAFVTFMNAEDNSAEKNASSADKQEYVR